MRGRLFYGWWVTAALALVVFLSTGIRFSAGPFLKPMVAELGIDRAAFSLVVSLGLLLYGVLMPVVGRMADRVGARPVLLAGALVLGGAVAGTGLVRRLWQLYLLQSVAAGAGLAAMSYVVASTVVSRWFVRRRGTALSILSAATMAGMGLMVPVVTSLILAVGWRLACGIVGVGTVLVVLPLVAWVIRESPEPMRLLPDGEPGSAASAPAGARAVGPGDAVQTGAFWLLSVPLSACGFSMGLLSAHGVPMLTDHGYHPMVASWAIGLLGATSMAFSVVLGLVSDRVGRRPVLAWIMAGRAAAFAMLFLVQDDPVLLLLLVALGGTSMAGSIAMVSALTADIFGRLSLGAVFGLMFVLHQVAAALGSWLGGLLFELTAGYGAAFAVACALLVLSALASLAITEPGRALARPGVAEG
jgi:MFS family permease